MGIIRIKAEINKIEAGITIENINLRTVFFFLMVLFIFKFIYLF